MKTIPEVIALINRKIEFHKSEINAVIQELTQMRKAGIPQTDEMKMKLMQSTMYIAENKGIINALSVISKEIQE